LRLVPRCSPARAFGLLRCGVREPRLLFSIVGRKSQRLVLPSIRSVCDDAVVVC
jgi:hypothetical protein